MKAHPEFSANQYKWWPAATRWQAINYHAINSHIRSDHISGFTNALLYRGFFRYLEPPTALSVLETSKYVWHHSMSHAMSMSCPITFRRRCRRFPNLLISIEAGIKNCIKENKNKIYLCLKGETTWSTALLHHCKTSSLALFLVRLCLPVPFMIQIKILECKITRS